MQEFIKKGVTTKGLPQNILSFLKMCTILEPMKDIMDRTRATNNTMVRLY